MILRSFRQRISTWLSLSKRPLPFQRFFYIHIFDQPLLYFQVNSFTYDLNKILHRLPKLFLPSFSYWTSFFPSFHAHVGPAERIEHSIEYWWNSPSLLPQFSPISSEAVWCPSHRVSDRLGVEWHLIECNKERILILLAL